MKKLHLLGVVALLSMAGAAMAEDKKADDQQAQSEKKICKSEKATGSLTRVNRICLTKAEWDAAREQAAKDVSRMDSNAHRYNPQAPAGMGAR